MTNDALTRVVITGTGIVSPIGNDVQSSWESLLAGVSGGAPITHFEATDDFACRIGCEAKGFDPLDYLDKREVKRHDRVSQFAAAAATQALREAGLEGVPEGGDPERFGVIFGSGIGGIEPSRSSTEGSSKRSNESVLFYTNVYTGYLSRTDLNW